jgi:hypothetical protein
MSVFQLYLPLAGCAVGVCSIPRPRSHCGSGGEPSTGLRPGSTPGWYEKGYRSMKVIDTPRTGKLGPVVFYPSPFGVCCHALAHPRDPKTPAQSRARQDFGVSSQGWGRRLSEPQRGRWIVAAQTVPTHPSLNRYSRVSGQQLCVKINSTLRCVGQAPTDEPPAPVVFSPNPVGDLTVGYDEAGNVQLLLAVGAAVEDIMLFGEAPRNAGRMKHRRVCYLGLLGPAANGRCDITAPYVARYGQPAPGQKIFVVTCQHKNGWKAEDHMTSAIVPPRPLTGEPLKGGPLKPEAATITETPKSQVAPAPRCSSLSRAVYKGCTQDARRVHKELKRVHPWSIRGAPLVHSLRMAIARLGMLGMGTAGV